MTVSNIGVIVVDSLASKVYIVDGYGIKSIISGLNFPVWARYWDGKVYISDVEEKEVSAWSMDGKKISSSEIYRPEMLKIYRGKVYVSSGKAIYELDKNLNVLRKWVFHSNSVYFYFFGDEMIYLNYWQWKDGPDVEIVDLKTGKLARALELGLERPLRYLRYGDMDVFLGYKSGDVVFVKGMDVVWRVNLPPFSYDMVEYKGKIVVSNLYRSGLYVIDPVIRSVEHVDLPYHFGDLTVLGDFLIGGAVYENALVVLDNFRLVSKEECGYPVMVGVWKGQAVGLCSNEGAVCFVNLW